MNHDDVNRVFELALAAPSVERDAMVRRLAAGDDGLYRAVSDLLAALARAGDLMDSPTATPAEMARDAGPGALAGTQIGPYKLLELIGEGGFGAVYMADQMFPIRRRVAFKVIKPGMDSRSVMARFEAERQALAIMDHPNIARVFDAGTTPSELGSRPYFVMELVRGVAITAYCDQARLTPRGRLELLVPVCRAVQHAHSKGIIHRDIKPANVLVTLHDGVPVPKVIDFGIAKATGAALTDNTVFTEFRALIGTPAYMSPEQAEMSGLDIDTRSDIYSLGVLMYELLTGSAPFDGTDLARAGLAEMQRIIREHEPPKPSTRVSTAGQGLRAIAEHRRSSPEQLARFVRGEPDWIIMRAMEKDRSRRYPTADALAADIARFLAGEPVLAAPPSAAYRIGKFICRYRVPVAAGGAVSTALLLGAVAFALQARAAGRQRDIAVAAQRAEAAQRSKAEAAQADATAQRARAEAQGAEALKLAAEAKAQAAIARAEAATAESVITFHNKIYASIDPSLLPEDGALHHDPALEAAVRSNIGLTLQNLGRFYDAETHLRRALELQRDARPSGDTATAHGRHLFHSLNNLAALLMLQHRVDEAEPLYLEAIELGASGADGDSELARTLGNLASLYYLKSRFPDAEATARRAVELDPTSAKHLNGLGMALQQQGKLAEAEPFLREAVDIRRATLVANDPEIGISLFHLASLLVYRHKESEAEPLYREALSIWRANFPPGHTYILETLRSLTGVSEALGRPEEAVAWRKQLLEISRKTLPPESPGLADQLAQLSTALLTRRAWSEAEPLLRECLAIRERIAPDAWTTFNTRSMLGGALLGLDNLSEAEPLLLDGYQGLKARETSIPADFRVVRISQAIERLMDLSTRRGDAPAAALWQSRLEALRAANADAAPPVNR